MDEVIFDFKQARKTFSRIGLALSAIMIAATLLQAVWILVPMALLGEGNWMTDSSWGVWIGSFLPLYGIAIPIGLLILRKLPARKPQSQKPGGKNFLIMLAISFFLMYAGNFVGTALSLLLSGGTAENSVVELAMDTNPLKVLVMVILAPLLEEYVCRKQVIDRTRQYGEKTAVLLSALLFGLLHQNLFQFFYAFALGLVFGYIYIRTGRLRYTVLLHGIINFMGAVIAPWILSLVDMDTLMTVDPNTSPEELAALYSRIMPGIMVLLAYAMLLLGTAVAGLVLLILKRKKLVWKPGSNQLPQGTVAKTVYANVGMVLYMVLCAGAFVLALL